MGAVGVAEVAAAAVVRWRDCCVMLGPNVFPVVMFFGDERNQTFFITAGPKNLRILLYFSMQVGDSLLFVCPWWVL